MRVMPPDMEMWVTGWLRAQLKADGLDVEVSNKEPAQLQAPLSRPLVVVRDDSGPRESVVTFSRALGVSVLAGTRQNDKPANDLARRVMAILCDPAIIEAAGSPIATIVGDGCNGPMAVTDALNVARRYSTVEYVAVGEF